jgi:DNA repair protein SbcD/Mre11
MGGMDGHERYAPCTLDDLRSRGYDYWALGHVHARQILCTDPPIVFAGNVQGRHIRESGLKGCLLATIEPGQQIEPIFQRLDQVRWERGSVDVAGLATESEILGRAADMFDGLLASETDPDAMLAIRVGFSGSTPLHGRLQTDSERFVAELHSLATERGGDRLWVERVELRTRPLSTATVPDGPFGELVDVIEQLRSDPASVDSVVEELSELKRRLPPELTHDLDGPQIDDAQWLQTLLDQVQPLLLNLLTHSESVDAT